ncbi:nuclear transport factor 2 family protein [Undibacterium squillarum]|uniref:nuclear transport factor 2 family protein n=1 Tax=Undibacterium squillarum TaxID=1131567 RepID=UPI0035B3F992
MKKPDTVVQRQLDAYNAHDLERFVAEYSHDVQVFRPPQPEPVLQGMQAFSEHYAKNRFTLPDLHAKVLNRIVSGNIVVDHEEVTGLDPSPRHTIAVYEVDDGLIRRVWFY